MASSSAGGSSGSYNSVIKGGLKLKGTKADEVGLLTEKKKKTKRKQELEQLMTKAREQEEEAMREANHKAEPTPAEKAHALARAKRQKERIGEAIELTHRQRMDRFNLHLGSLSEHFDIPKVGPG
eukprot:gnl/TRDRNA2_/TRDRNA2_39655_c0_seq1.p1 gnl/TRDRNA2_/TRDRNA2_39655_c0~~gnl/TRDRNA2_/TRDRNA2_39655_c0_seq1.p1  ORF type:complete len:125 (+),score=35.03 gnl/TRDRNA2_/TRDRNA2_39655_c0_seq1:192-566(+)